MDTARSEPSAMTVGELIDFYLAHHVAFLKNRRGTTARIQTYLSQFGAVPLSALKRMQVIEWRDQIMQTRGSGAANLALQQLHAIYARAKEWDLYDGPNPAAGVKPFRRRSRTRFLQPNEMPWLLHALGEESYRGQAFFLCLLFTGARLGEVQDMTWADLDLERALWHKPTTKTDVPHTVPMPQVLVDRFRRLPRVAAWVFPACPNGKNGMHPGRWCRTAIQSAWRQIRKRAGLPDVRIHDLRRTCASWLAIHGENLFTIQGVLNHSSLAVTQVYARLTTGPVRRALEAQATRMLGTQPASQASTKPAPLPTQAPRPPSGASQTWTGPAGRA